MNKGSMTTDEYVKLFKSLVESFEFVGQLVLERIMIFTFLRV